MVNEFLVKSNLELFVNSKFLAWEKEDMDVFFFFFNK
jgi:hypothetical protein